METTIQTLISAERADEVSHLLTSLIRYHRHELQFHDEYVDLADLLKHRIAAEVSSEEAERALLSSYDNHGLKPRWLTREGPCGKQVLRMQRKARRAQQSGWIVAQPQHETTRDRSRSPRGPL